MDSATNSRPDQSIQLSDSSTISAKSVSVVEHFVVVEKHVGQVFGRQQRDKLFELALFIFISPTLDAVKAVVATFGRHGPIKERVDTMPQIEIAADLFDGFGVPGFARGSQAKFISPRSIFLKNLRIFLMLVATLDKFRWALKKNCSRIKGFCRLERHLPSIVDSFGRFECSDFLLFLFGQLAFEPFIRRAAALRA